MLAPISLLTSPPPYKGGAAAWTKQNTPSMSHHLQTFSFGPGPLRHPPQFPQTSRTPRHPWALWAACWSDGACGPGRGRARAGLWGGSLRDPARPREWGGRPPVPKRRLSLPVAPRRPFQEGVGRTMRDEEEEEEEEVEENRRKEGANLANHSTTRTSLKNKAKHPTAASATFESLPSEQSTSWINITDYTHHDVDTGILKRTHSEFGSFSTIRVISTMKQVSYRRYNQLWRAEMPWIC